MRIDPLDQAHALLLALLIGVGAGLLYDLLRPLRWHGHGLGALLPDLLFCLTLGAGLFVYAMSLGDGRLGLGATAAAWLGFAAYHRLLSPRLLPLFVNVFQIMDNTSKYCKKTIKKCNFFKKSTLKK